ncbi:DUF262 domain-containing protein [Brevundimonas sp. TWP1-2-1b1]|uniref:DUF262 domain-containing protein n=1 Tax=unclassified Brevundimonas TaxID=2622653 RepID=UPI003CEAE7D4
MASYPDLFSLFDEDPSDETLDDVRVAEQDVAETVLYNTDWTIETLLGQISKRNIDLTPSFQRRDAWTIKRKSQFIESMILNFPVPALTLAEIGRSKTYIVVDGKQRITSLAQFFGEMGQSAANGFKLAGLEQLRELNGCDWSNLQRLHPRHATALENYSIRTNVIRGWKADDVLYSIFLRLNSGSVKLSAQELRQALSPGPFSNFIMEYAEVSPGLRAVFPGPEPDFRMRDIELMLRYLGYRFFLEDYRGQLKQFLDMVAKTFNEDWATWEPRVRDAVDVFEAAYDANDLVFQGQRFNKWSDGRWENRLNRAVFDVQMYYLNTVADIPAYVKQGPNIVQAFQVLCEQDPLFRSSLETTTKSVDAVAYRLKMFGGILVALGLISKTVDVDANGALVNA